ncbi:hypothetical protein HK097_006304 [Rhizophlyctis rosea]|uniref:Rhodanese domain-containing protein n=1 Tax=Rhizophlyctis rosea TaxID=64517 RepID=A0AAD5RZV1_9FUNG|nr:hypothetical protein HK097_006304 [Rhizophlyctis rosea]
MTDHTHINSEHLPVKWTTTDAVVPILKDTSKVAGRDYRIVDARTPEEFSSGHVPGAVNLVEQDLVKDAAPAVEAQKDVPLLIFYCGKSQGRGPRAAHAYQQALEAAGKKEGQEVLVLKGGIVGWKEAGLDLSA